MQIAITPFEVGHLVDLLERSRLMMGAEAEVDVSWEGLTRMVTDGSLTSEEVATLQDAYQVLDDFHRSRATRLLNQVQLFLPPHRPVSGADPATLSTEYLAIEALREGILTLFPDFDPQDKTTEYFFDYDTGTEILRRSYHKQMGVVFRKNKVPGKNPDRLARVLVDTLEDQGNEALAAKITAAMNRHFQGRFLADRRAGMFDLLTVEELLAQSPDAERALREGRSAFLSVSRGRVINRDGTLRLGFGWVVGKPQDPEIPFVELKMIDNELRIIRTHRQFVRPKIARRLVDNDLAEFAFTDWLSLVRNSDDLIFLLHQRPDTLLQIFWEFDPLKRKKVLYLTGSNRMTLRPDHNNDHGFHLDGGFLVITAKKPKSGWTYVKLKRKGEQVFVADISGGETSYRVAKAVCHRRNAVWLHRFSLEHFKDIGALEKHLARNPDYIDQLVGELYRLRRPPFIFIYESSRNAILSDGSLKNGLRISDSDPNIERDPRLRLACVTLRLINDTYWIVDDAGDDNRLLSGGFIRGGTPAVSRFLSRDWVTLRDLVAHAGEHPRFLQDLVAKASGDFSDEPFYLGINITNRAGRLAGELTLSLSPPTYKTYLQLIEEEGEYFVLDAGGNFIELFFTALRRTNQVEVHPSEASAKVVALEETRVENRTKDFDVLAQVDPQEAERARHAEALEVIKGDFVGPGVGRGVAYYLRSLRRSPNLSQDFLSNGLQKSEFIEIARGDLNPQDQKRILAVARIYGLDEEETTTLLEQWVRDRANAFGARYPLAEDMAEREKRVLREVRYSFFSNHGGVVRRLMNAMQVSSITLIPYLTTGQWPSKLADKQKFTNKLSGALYHDDPERASTFLEEQLGKGAMGRYWKPNVLEDFSLVTVEILKRFFDVIAWELRAMPPTIVLVYRSEKNEIKGFVPQENGDSSNMNNRYKRTYIRRLGENQFEIFRAGVSRVNPDISHFRQSPAAISGSLIVHSNEALIGGQRSFAKGSPPVLEFIERIREYLEEMWSVELAGGDIDSIEEDDIRLAIAFYLYEDDWDQVTDEEVRMVRHVLVGQVERSSGAFLETTSNSPAQNGTVSSIRGATVSSTSQQSGRNAGNLPTTPEIGPRPGSGQDGEVVRQQMVFGGSGLVSGGCWTVGSLALEAGPLTILSSVASAKQPPYGVAKEKDHRPLTVIASPPAADEAIQLEQKDPRQSAKAVVADTRRTDKKATLKSIERFMIANGYAEQAQVIHHRTQRKLPSYAQNFKQMTRHRKMQVVRQLSREISSRSTASSKPTDMMKFGAAATFGKVSAGSMMVRAMAFRG